MLACALNGLSPAERRTLHVLAGFRLPAGMETIKALLLRRDGAEDPAKQPFAALGELLDAALTTLEDRGLLGWDRRANRYDLHPIVRGVVWNGLGDRGHSDIYGTLQTHFEAMPMVEYWQQVESLEDLTPAIELYHTLIGLERYDAAYELFRDRLEKATLYRLSSSRLRVDLLERLFPDGPDALPRLSQAYDQSYALNSLATGYVASGQPDAAIPLFEGADEILVGEGNQEGDSVSLENLSNARRLSGGLWAAELAARAALNIAQDQEDRFAECVSLYWLGLARAARGVPNQAAAALHRSERLSVAQSKQQSEGIAAAFLAERALWQGEAAAARPLADRARNLAAVLRYEVDFIQAARLQGSAALHLGDFDTADERLHHALTRARAVQLVEEELPTLVALADLRRRQGQPGQVRELLEEVWEPAKRGPYPLFHADALNILAQLERDAGNEEAAIEAATAAFRQAWCDGPPFAYHWGLEKAWQHLAALAAPEPALPPFDESKFEPVPQVEINPPDEFGGEA